MIRIRGLKKRLGAKQVLDGVDLDIAAGETVVVMGRSGTGKSVLLKHIIGLMRADHGSIQVEGEEIPVAPEVKAHSIIAVKGNGSLETAGDGVVKYRSASIQPVPRRARMASIRARLTPKSRRPSREAERTWMTPALASRSRSNSC